MNRFEDSELEKLFLRGILVPPFHAAALKLDQQVFCDPVNKRIFALLKQNITRYGVPPLEDVLRKIIEEGVEQELLADAIIRLEDLLILQPPSEIKQLEDALWEMKLGRDLYAVGKHLKEGLENKAFGALFGEVKEKIFRLHGVTDESSRGMHFEGALDRWKEFRYKQDHPGELVGIPCGISELDTLTGGLRKTHVVLFYGSSGGGKSRTLISIGYNTSRAGWLTMYVSLEMDRLILDKCFDSRDGLLLFDDIDFGKLSPEDSIKYKDVLKDQVKRRDNLYIVDSPKGMKPSGLVYEIELFNARFSRPPDVIIVDYINLMDSDSRIDNRSEKYDYIGRDLHSIARMYSTSIVTVAQESRESTLTRTIKKGKMPKLMGIGVSNYLAPHCELVGHLYQDELDELEHRLRMDIEKNRYGKCAELKLFESFAHNYVGDRVISKGGG